MKRMKIVLTVLFLAFGVTTIYATCPQTNCSTDCGSSGSSCYITQYDESGNVCSWTFCYGKRGIIE